MMSTKPKRRHGPRLDRRNAIKHIDYDASISSTSSSSCSSSFDDQSTHRARSLVFYPPNSDRTSFRMEGIDGEFDRICRSLGLSGPEDFAIPAAAWEARKVRSPTDHFPSSLGFVNRYSDSPEDDGGLAEGFEAKVRVKDALNVKHENESIVQLKKNGRSSAAEENESRMARVKVNGDEAEIESKLEGGLISAAEAESKVRVSDEARRGGGGDDASQSKRNVGRSVRVRVFRDGETGIRGARPAPVLAPPPAVISLATVDDVTSTWDLFWSFGPHDNEDLMSPAVEGPISSSNEVKENEDVDGRILGKQEPNVAELISSTVRSDSCSDTSNDDDSCGAIAEPAYSVSLNGQSICSIYSWQKGDFIGSGSFGTVYEGFTDDGFFFAVKEVSLLDQGSQGKQSIFQLEQEISLLSRFQHENIVRYLGTDKDDGKLYIFLELVTKGSLSNLYQKYHLRDSQVSSYTRQILNGLKYLHDQNVVHRDIKCANILVDASGSVKLADFGLAKATKLNDVKSCKGTAFWMAPEVVNRKNQGYGLAADVWSLGCTVLEMLTGQIPYSDLEGMQALFRIGRGIPPPIPDTLSRDAQDFILKCLQVKPDCRPTAAQLLGHPFVKRPSSTSLGPASPHYVGIRS